MNDEIFEEQALSVFSLVSPVLRPPPWSLLIRLTKVLLVVHAFHLSASITPLGFGIDLLIIVPRVLSPASLFLHSMPSHAPSATRGSLPANKVSTVSRSDNPGMIATHV